VAGVHVRAYSAHSPFAQFRQFAVLVVAWTFAVLAKPNKLNKR